MLELVTPTAEELKTTRYRIGDIVHIVSDDGFCTPGLITMQFPDHPEFKTLTMFPPVPQAVPMCVGQVKYDADQTPRTWHDMHRCKKERGNEAKRILSLD